MTFPTCYSPQARSRQSSVHFTTINMLPPQGDTSLTHVIKGLHKRHIDSINMWLQAGNVYEKLVMDAQTACYIASKFNLLIANFAGPLCICWIYTQMVYANKLLYDACPHPYVLDKTLYATVLDTSALRPDPCQCSRCKSLDHLVKDCTFPVSDPMEENLLQKTTGSSRTNFGNQSFSGQNLGWKYVKWHSPSGQEGCNLFQ